MGKTGRGKGRRKGLMARELQEPTGTWIAGRGQQYSKRRDEQWMPAGVDPFPGEQAVQDRNRENNRVQREMQLSIKVADGEGGLGHRG